jgi:hypothetical protein
MMNSESPAQLFEFFRSRFPPGTLPAWIIYDNACNAYNYCVRRNPALFRETRFVVDRFHWKNHVRCNTGYRMYEWSHYDSIIEDIPSQMCEVWNKQLRRIALTISFSTSSNAVWALQAFAYLKAFMTRRAADKARNFRLSFHSSRRGGAFPGTAVTTSTTTDATVYNADEDDELGDEIVLESFERVPYVPSSFSATSLSPTEAMTVPLLPDTLVVSDRLREGIGGRGGGGGGGRVRG